MNQQNHITLFPVQQSVEEGIQKDFDYMNKNQMYYPSISYKEEHERIFKAGIEWAVKNNYKGE